MKEFDHYKPSKGSMIEARSLGSLVQVYNWVSVCDKLKASHCMYTDPGQCIHTCKCILQCVVIAASSVVHGCWSSAYLNTPCWGTTWFTDSYWQLEHSTDMRAGLGSAACCWNEGRVYAVVWVWQGFLAAVFLGGDPPKKYWPLPPQKKQKKFF